MTRSRFIIFSVRYSVESISVRMPSSKAKSSMSSSYRMMTDTVVLAEAGVSTALAVRISVGGAVHEPGGVCKFSGLGAVVVLGGGGVARSGLRLSSSSSDSESVELSGTTRRGVKIAPPKVGVLGASTVKAAGFDCAGGAEGGAGAPPVPNRPDEVVGSGSSRRCCGPWRSDARREAMMLRIAGNNGAETKVTVGAGAGGGAVKRRCCG